MPILTIYRALRTIALNEFSDFLKRTIAECPAGLSPEVTRHLAHLYGSGYSRILAYLAEQPTWAEPVSAGSTVLRAEIVYAVREEMAHKLADVIQRRTGLGVAGLPDETVLQNCANIMAAELGWSQTQKRQEIDEVRVAYV